MGWRIGRWLRELVRRTDNNLISKIQNKSEASEKSLEFYLLPQQLFPGRSIYIYWYWCAHNHMGALIPSCCFWHSYQIVWNVILNTFLISLSLSLLKLNNENGKNLKTPWQRCSDWNRFNTEHREITKKKIVNICLDISIYYPTQLILNFFKIRGKSRADKSTPFSTHLNLFKIYNLRKFWGSNLF